MLVLFFIGRGSLAVLGRGYTPEHGKASQLIGSCLNNLLALFAKCLTREVLTSIFISNKRLLLRFEIFFPALSRMVSPIDSYSSWKDWNILCMGVRLVTSGTLVMFGSSRKAHNTSARVDEIIEKLTYPGSISFQVFVRFSPNTSNYYKNPREVGKSMELDFQTVKALSSPTRIKILNEALAGEPTPTELSDKVDKSKSTVSSHLDQLREAGLLEKDEEEGRRRVVYQPTSKTKAIIEGRSRKVKFSLTSSIVSAWVGVGLALGALNQLQKSSKTDSAGQMGAMDLAAEQETAKTASETALASPENALLFAGLGFLTIAVGSLVYGLVISRMKK